MGLCPRDILQLAQDGDHLVAKGATQLLRERQVDQVLPPNRHSLV